MVCITPPGYAPSVRTLLPLCMLVLGAANTASASDFWDDVRTPGRAAARALGREARRALAEGRLEEALSTSKRIISLDSKTADNHVILGRVLSAMSHYREASTAFHRALALSPRALDHAGYGADAAKSACRAGDYPLAATILRRLVSHVPPGAQRDGLFALQGDVLLALGPDSLRRALTAYEHALRDATTPDAMLQLGLAVALMRAGHDADALKRVPSVTRKGRLRDTIERLPLPPTERQARLALLLEARGNRAAARRAWGLAAEAGPWATVDGARAGGSR